MADRETLEFLMRDIPTWNKWRNVNCTAFVDLTEADLTRVNLRMADLHRALLIRANLEAAVLSGADFEGSVLTEANLKMANLAGAVLAGANLEAAVLAGANLEEAVLTGANLKMANLERANLYRAALFSANLTGANPDEANFEGAVFGETIICNIDLSKVQGLNAVKHCAPSTISLDTLRKSKGNIPDNFLFQCGMSLWEIEIKHLYDPSLSSAELSDILSLDIFRKREDGP